MKTWFSSDFIKFHQSSSKESRFWKKNWILMKFNENMVFHQISSKFIKKIKVLKKNWLWWNLIKFDENMVFHQISSNFIKKIKVLKKKWTLMKFDENLVFHQISSNFIKVHQSSSKLNSFEKMQQPVIETRFRFATPWKSWN